MATAEQNFTDSKPLFSPITPEEYLNPHGTSQEIISDANRIQQLLMGDRNHFINAGIDPAYLDTLPARIDSFTIASVQADTAVAEEVSAKTDWLTNYPRGQKLDQELSRHFSFLYRRNKPVLKEVKEVLSGSGNDDTILDLKKFSMIGRNNPAELEAAPLFDMALLDEADTLHEDLTRYLAAYEAAPKATKELNRVKRQTFTWLETALNEIRDFAEYIFHNNEEKLKQYKRDYFKV